MTFKQIKTVKAIEKYKLHVLFNDGIMGVYNAGHLAGKGVFKSWDSDNNFEKVFISPDSGAITWPGEIDIDTVTVYCSIKGIKLDDWLNSYQHATHI
jgi:Protein of unknown function (DUF2442)